MLAVQKPRRSRAGCVPVIRNEEGEIVSVLLVTSGQFQGKYILPAGKVEDSDLRLEEAALRSENSLLKLLQFVVCAVC